MVAETEKNAVTTATQVHSHARGSLPTPAGASGLQAVRARRNSSAAKAVHGRNASGSSARKYHPGRPACSGDRKRVRFWRPRNSAANRPGKRADMYTYHGAASAVPSSPAAHAAGRPSGAQERVTAA